MKKICALILLLSLTALSGMNAYGKANDKTVYILTGTVNTVSAASTPQVGKITKAKDFFESAYGANTIRLPVNFSQDKWITVIQKSDSFQIRPENEKGSASLLNGENAYKVKSDYIQYKNSFENEAILNCYITASGISADIVIPQYTGMNTYRLKFKYPGAEADASSRDYICFTKNDNKALLSVPIITDKNREKWSNTNGLTILNKDSSTGIYTLELNADDSFLKDKKTKYPVTLSFQVNINVQNQIDLPFYSSKGPKSEFLYSPYIFLGDSTTKGDSKTYVSLNLPDAIKKYKPEDIVSVKYIVHNAFASSKKTKVNLYPITEAWCHKCITWTFKVECDKNPAAKATIQKQGGYAFDITKLFRLWLKNSTNDEEGYRAENGFMLAADTSGSNILLTSADSGYYAPYYEIVVKNK